MNKFVVYNGNGPQLIRNALIKRGNWEELPEDSKDIFNNVQFIWKPTNFSVVSYTNLDLIIKERPKDFIQIINHFEDIRGICTKTGLIRSLKQYYNQNDEASMQYLKNKLFSEKISIGKAKYTIWDSTATSFIITSGVEDTEYTSFLARFKDLAKQNYSKETLAPKHCQENIWLIKPANMNQGRGIEVFRSLKDILHFLNTKPINSYWVAQKYIEKPLLYYGRKFDIRMWCVFTVNNEVFVYKKGYMRTSSFEYDMKNQNNYVHLTNNCLQKHGDNYGKHEEGNTLGLEVLDKYIQSLYPNYNFDFNKHIYQRMKDLMIDTYLCTKRKLNPNKRKNCFELFGYDFLIDEDLKTWLIEVNTNPYLGIPNEYINDLLPKMIDDMLDIALDPLIPPKNEVRNGRSNDYELIYCENSSVYHPGGPFNDRSIFTKNVYPISELIPEFGRMQKFKKDIVNKKFEKEETKEFDKDKDRDEQEILVMKNRSSSLTTDTPSNNNNNNNNKHINGDNGNSITGLKNNNIESIYNNLYNNIYEKNIVDPSYIQYQISRIFSGLNNWELLSEKQSRVICKSLKLISNSSVNFLLAEYKNIIQIIKLINSCNISLNIQLTVFECMIQICKDLTIKKKILCNKLIHELLTICISSCYENTLQQYNIKLKLAAIKLIYHLSGVDKRKSYIPGETRELEKIKKFFITQGGLIAIMILAEKSLDDKIKTIAQCDMLNLFSSVDWEYQIQILDAIKNSNNPIMDHIKLENSIIDIKNDNNMLQSQSISIVEDNNTNNINMNASMTNPNEYIFYQTGNFLEIKDKIPEGFMNIPKILLSIWPFEDIYEKVKSTYKAMKENIMKREIEEKEKREKHELQKQKKEEEMRLELDQKRKQAFENFEARYKENIRKQQRKIAKKEKVDLLFQAYFRGKRDMEESKQRDIDEKIRLDDRIKQKVIDTRYRKYKEDMNMNMKSFEQDTNHMISSKMRNDQAYTDEKDNHNGFNNIKGARTLDAYLNFQAVIKNQTKSDSESPDNRGRANELKLPSISKEKLITAAKERGYHSEEKIILNSIGLIKHETSDSGDDTTKFKNSIANVKRKDPEWKKNLTRESLQKAYPYLQPLYSTWNITEKRLKFRK